ncbi:MAG: LysR family transcriptional regulator [Micromonosporaceae bacterium]
MNLQQLRYIVATVDHQTMTAAAEALHVSQPALTRAVRALERELGTPLFVRSGRRVLPTPAGLAVARHARRALGELDQLQGVAARQPVSIATTPTLAAYLMPRLLRPLLARDPGLTVALRNLPSPLQVAAEVESGHAVLGLVDLPVRGNLTVTPVTDREVVLLCPRGSPARSPMPLPRLPEFAFIVPAAGSYRRTRLDALFGRLRASPRIVCETDERCAWSTLTAAGVGHALMARSQAEQADPRRTRIVSFDPPIRQTVALLHRPGQLSGAQRLLVDVVRERCLARLGPVLQP